MKRHATNVVLIVWALVCLALAIAFSAVAEAADPGQASQAEPGLESARIHQDLPQLVCDLSFTAGMNQQYYQTTGERCRYPMAVAAFIAAIMALSCAAICMFGWRGIATLFAGITATAIAITACLGVLYSTEREFYSDWTEIRRDADVLLFDLDGPPDESLPNARERYRKLLITRHAIEAREGAPDDALVMKCYRDETRRRWGAAKDDELAIFEERHK